MVVKSAVIWTQLNVRKILSFMTESVSTPPEATKFISGYKRNLNHYGDLLNCKAYQCLQKLNCAILQTTKEVPEHLLNKDHRLL